MVDWVNEGVVKRPPVPTAFPPVKASYQVSVPPLEVASKVKVPLPHRDCETVERIEKPSDMLKDLVTSAPCAETNETVPDVAVVVVGAGRM